MATNQPTWRCIANLGDVNPIEYGGVFVYVDETGVYPAEAEYLDAPDDGAEPLTAYRVVLERCTDVDGVLSDNPYHPEHAVWFAKDLAAVAACVDYPGGAPALRAAFCSAEPLTLARAYEAVASYHGWHEFDHDPLVLGPGDAEARYEKDLASLDRS